MKIAGLHKLSTIDYPGRLSAVLFTNGCNYNCWYCHNRQLIDGQAVNIAEDEIIRFLEKRRELLSAVVISGGEPTLQKDLPDFILRLKQMGYLVKLDSNGSAPAMLAACLDMIDYAAIDYKAPEEFYTKICGVPAYENVKKSLLLLGESSIGWEARTTMIPELSGMEERLMQEVKELTPKNPPRIHRFNRYIPNGGLREI